MARPLRVGAERLQVARVSWLDNDKILTLDVFEALQEDSTLEFLGWLGSKAFRDASQASTVVFAPGRCALGTVSCVLPAIAVGSKSYVGLVQPGTWQQAVYSDLGDVDNRHKDYNSSKVHQDLDQLFISESYRTRLGVFGVQIVQQFFDAQQVHEQLLGIYRLAIQLHLLNKVSVKGFDVLGADSLKSDNKKAEVMLDNQIEQLETKLLQASKDNACGFTKDLLVVQNRLYAQLESLSWLHRRLAIKGQLPPLRGWAASPDVLLRLHTHIMATRPRVVVEFGSGASTLVIVDALSQNGTGKLVSIEHSDHYGALTLETLEAEQLQGWVDLRVGDLEPWEGEHLNPEDAEKPSRWYTKSLLDDIEQVDLLWVDGPPGATCLFSRYPALPALADKLSPHAEVWLDDTIRQEEQDICERWAKDGGFVLSYYPLEKGLGRLIRKGSETNAVSEPVSPDDLFDFSISDDQQG